MAVAIKTSPRTTCPIPVSHPLIWELETNDHITQAGVLATFSVEFSFLGSNPNGEQVTIMGHVFEVDNTNLFTSETWAYQGGAQASATNFSNMLKANFYFQDFNISVASSGSNWIVSAIATTVGVKPGWTFDVSGLTNAVVLTEANGSNLEFEDYRIWYRLYLNEQPVTSVRYADIPYDPQVNPQFATLDLMESARRTLECEPPTLSQSDPDLDTDIIGDFTLRFGNVVIDENCEQSFGLSTISPEVQVVNSVFQLRDFNEFKMHCIQFNQTPEFMNRCTTPNSIGLATYAWLTIYLELKPGETYHPDDKFRVHFEFFDKTPGTVVHTQDITEQDSGVWKIPTGTANPNVLPFVTASLTHYTVKIEHQVDPGGGYEWQNYSEVCTYHIANFCDDIQMYFKEDRGGFGTVQFDRIDSVRIGTESVELERYFNNFQSNPNIALKGGISDKLQSAALSVTLLSRPIRNEQERLKWEDFLRADIHYYLDTYEAFAEGKTIRRVNIERGGFTTFENGRPTRVAITITFQENLRTR